MFDLVTTKCNITDTTTVNTSAEVPPSIVVQIYLPNSIQYAREQRRRSLRFKRVSRHFDPHIKQGVRPSSINQRSFKPNACAEPQHCVIQNLAVMTDRMIDWRYVVRIIKYDATHNVGSGQRRFI
ncbi:hypothetical protein D3C84_861470 [compost metagenome]